MPLLKVETTVALSDDKRQGLLSSLSKLVTENIGKPEKYVMTSITPATIMMSGESVDAAFVDLRSVGGLGDAVNRKLSHGICAVLKESLNIPPERIYLHFTDVNGGNWGWNGNTFG